MSRLEEIIRRDADWKKEVINTENWPIADRRWLLERVQIQDSVINVNRIANESARNRLETCEAALRQIGIVCAQLPPFEELDEPGYDQLMDAIQNTAREAVIGSTSSGDGEHG